jgi:hypothetical protein
VDTRSAILRFYLRVEKRNRLEAGHYESIVNKMPLTPRTNHIVGGKAPSAYLYSIQKSAGISEARMDEILSSHEIEPSALRADDFDAFFKVREQVLLELWKRLWVKPSLTILRKWTWQSLLTTKEKRWQCKEEELP